MRRVCICLSLLISAPLCAQQSYLASPGKIGMVVGETQRVQILDAFGKNVPEVRWSIEPEEIASIAVEKGFGLVEAKAVGKATITGTVGDYTVKVAATIYPGDRLPPGVIKWASPPLAPEMRLLEQVRSLRVATTTPELYILEGNERTQRIRAFAEDGVQEWIWPSSTSSERIQLRCADNFGGVVLATERDGQAYVTVLKQDGTERWRATTGAWWAYTYTPGNVLYIVEDHRDYREVPVLSGFDGESGELKLQIPLPANVTQHIGYTPPLTANNLCLPGKASSRSGQSAHGSLVTDENGVVHIPVITMEVVFDATGCTPGMPIDRAKAKLREVTHIQLLSLYPNGESSWQTVRRLDHSVVGWVTPTEWIGPWGSTIPDGHGGVLIAARGQIGNVLTRKVEAERGAIFRVHDGAVQEFDMPVLPPRLQNTPNMLLGDNDIGFFAGDRSIVAYNVLDGRILWLWKSEEPMAMNRALADGGIMVSAGQRGHKLIRLDAHGKIAEITDMDKAP